MPDVNGEGTAKISREQMRGVMSPVRLPAFKVEPTKAVREVLIMASGPTAAEAPIAQKRAEGAAVWGLNAVHRQLDPWLFTAFFQLHRVGSGEGHIDDPDHKAWLEAWGTDKYPEWVELYGGDAPHLGSGGHEDPAVIYTSEESGRWPMGRRYPLEDVAKDVGPMGRKYFTNTVDYMVAFALFEGYTRIGLFGADMISDGDNEYTKMRQSLEYYVGVARGRGVELYIPDKSALCRARRVYGFEEKPKHDENLLKLMRGQQTKIREELEDQENKRREIIASINACKGGLRAFDAIIKLVERRERGSQL